MVYRNCVLVAALLAASATAAAQQQSTPAGAATASPATQQQPAQPGASAQAQNPQQQQLTPQQQAALAQQDAEMTKAAQQVMQMVDGNRIGDVWDGASAAMKRVVTRDAFIKQITTDRNRLGSPAGRGQANISRAQYPAGAQVPQGLYINIATPTKFANSAQQVRELVSFRLDEDKTWRVSGYSLR